MNTEKPRRKEEGIMCPLFRQDVHEVCHNCEWYCHIRGENPNTGEKVDHWGCSVSFLPVLQIETSQQVRGVQKTTESFRNATINEATVHQAMDRLGVRYDITRAQLENGAPILIEAQNGKAQT
jgi:hypothetical protein